MKSEGVTIDTGEQAWFFKHKLGLTEMQKQMLETTLGVETDDYAACEREAMRLFKRIVKLEPPLWGHKPIGILMVQQVNSSNLFVLEPK